MNLFELARMYSRGMFECFLFEDFMEFTFLRLRPAKPNPLTMLETFFFFSIEIYLRTLNKLSKEIFPLNSL